MGTPENENRFGGDDPLREFHQRAADVFPLPVTSIERLHLAEFTDQCPNDICCRLVLEGRIDRNALDTALTHTVSRHPLLYSRLTQRGRTSVARWELLDDPVTTVQWGSKDDDEPSLDVDLAEGRNVIVRAIERPESESAEIWMRSHHAVCDGVGGIQFVNDWLHIYDNLVRGREPFDGLHRLEPQSLAYRNHLRLFGSRYLKHTVKQPIALFGAAKFLFRKIHPLAIESQEVEGAESAFPQVVGAWLAEDEARIVLEAARRRSISLFAWLQGCLYGFLLQHPAGQAYRDGGWIRLLIPMNLRDISDRRMPACNRTAVVQMDRRRDQIEDAATFFHYLDREVGLIRRWQLNKLFLLVVRAMAVVPGWLERSSRRATCRGAAVFTSLGSPFRRSLRRRDRRPVVGQARIVDFDFVGPVRQGTPVYVCLQRESAELRISMRFDPRLFSHATAQAFTEDFVAFLRRASAEDLDEG